MGLEVEELNGDSLVTRRSAKHEGVAVGRPVGIEVNRVSGHELLGAVAVRGDDVNLPGLVAGPGHESDLIAVGRPTRQDSLQGWIGELELPAAVQLAAPECALRYSDVRRPLAIFGKAQLLGRN